MDLDPSLKVLSSVATAAILVSVGLCIRTIWTKWSTELPGIDKLIALRNNKTKWLHGALIVLTASLAFYLILIVVGLFT